MSCLSCEAFEKLSPDNQKSDMLMLVALAEYLEKMPPITDFQFDTDEDPYERKLYTNGVHKNGVHKP
jgi:hypothetical protein